MDLKPIFDALNMREWYAFAALVLAAVIQVIRKNPDLPLLKKLKALWNKTPDGYRFLWPATIGAVTAFVAAFEAGTDLRGALLAALGGALGIGVPSMGVAAILKESAIPWDGGKGGQPKDPPASGGVQKGSDVLRGLSTLGLCAFLFSCSAGDAPKPPSSLPPDDPCALQNIVEFAVKCAAECRLNSADEPNPCLDKCEADIDERCTQ